MSGRLEVRSFRVCFDLERRIHRVDRWRLPVPWGVPLRGVAYALVALAVMLAAGVLPGVGLLVGALPAPLRWVVLPVGVAVVLVRWRLDGRPAHRALLAIVRQQFGPQTLQGYSRCRRGRAEARAEARYAPVALARDRYTGGLRRGRVVGPAQVSVRGCAGVRQRGRRLVVETGGQEAGLVAVDVADGQVLEVRS
jgi:hypothetical protein